jgi:hypothetical protein
MSAERYTAYDSGGDYWIILGPDMRRFCRVGRGKRKLARKLARFANKVADAAKVHSLAKIWEDLHTEEPEE